MTVILINSEMSILCLFVIVVRLSVSYADYSLCPPFFLFFSSEINTDVRFGVLFDLFDA